MLTVSQGMIELDKPSLVIAAASLIALFLIFVIAEPKLVITKRRLRDKYRLIYRVVSVPSDNQFVMKAEGTAIEVGDYGWEAEPIFEDGLIYLHGLNPGWQVAWYAGFRPEQVEVVGPKPRSQYYIYPDWVDAKEVPQCPFPVQKHQFGMYPTFHFGFAVKKEGDWVQGRRIKVCAKKEKA